MAEYYFALTDINNAIDRLIRACPTTFYNGLQAARNIFSKDLAADVQPVRHGRWLRITEYEGEGKKRKEASHYCICSVCKETATAGVCFWDNETPYCPWCGAKMDGGENK